MGFEWDESEERGSADWAERWKSEVASSARERARAPMMGEVMGLTQSDVAAGRLTRARGSVPKGVVRVRRNSSNAKTRGDSR